MTAARVLIVVSLAFLVYVHIGYPVLLMVWRRFAHRPVRKEYWEPSVSILIAAHNEKDTIAAKLLNCLQLDYPAEKVEVVVALDAPTDGTDQVVRQHLTGNIKVVSLPRRQGKSGALNHAAALAHGDILVFADARQRFDRSALRELTANFRDPAVGSVSGELILLDEHGREAANAAGIYWRYEKWIRAREAEIHSMMGATGAIYAIRRELFKRVPPDTILDDVAIPMSIVLRGKRAVFDGSARAYDQVASDPEIEYGRKVRTLMGNYQLLAYMPELLAPFRNPVWFQFVSHKVARLAVPYFLVLLLVANLFAADGVYLWLLAAQGGWYAAAGLGALLLRRRNESAALARIAVQGGNEA